MLPTLPPVGGPRLALPPEPPQQPAASDAVRITPAGFRVTGNTLFSSEALLARIANRAGQATTLAGLNEIARTLREYYQDRGYLLTDALIPQQSLPREGGTVTIEIIEARVGQVTVKLEDAASQRAAAVVLRALPRGAIASEYLLDRPVLLVRDIPGHDAVATVQPGGGPGEVDVVVTVSARRASIEPSVGLDNHGVRSAGQLRAFAAAEINNLTGTGDALSLRAQLGEITATRLYRVAYSAPPLDVGTRATLALARSEYALGGAFKALGATGEADVAGVTVMHPLLRGRLHSIYAVGALEAKSLNDRTTASPEPHKQVVQARLGIAGNAVDEAIGSTGFTSYAASASVGRLKLDGASAAADATLGDARSAGDFTKTALELQRTQFLSPRWSLFASAQAQKASRNLTSAEKMTLGGPTGVRAYAAGEGVGDSGALVSVELRYQLLLAPLPLTVGAFYDAGHVRLSERAFAPGSNQRNLSGAGLSLQAGTPGRFTTTVMLAWRTGSDTPTPGEPTRSPRVWFAGQGWF